MNAGALPITVLCLAAGASAPAIAQQSPFRAPPGQSAAPPPGTLREGSGPPTPGALYIVEQPGNTLLATEYIGRSIQGPGNQPVGTVSNLLVDSTGRVTGIVIDVGGFLEYGAKEIAIAFEAIYPVMENGREALLVEMIKDQLAAAPAFKRSR
jgi:hypothetical protein